MSKQRCVTAAIGGAYRGRSDLSSESKVARECFGFVYWRPVRLRGDVEPNGCGFEHEEVSRCTCSKRRRSGLVLRGENGVIAWPKGGDLEGKAGSLEHGDLRGGPDC